MLGLTAGRYLHRWPDQQSPPHQLPVVPHYRRFWVGLLLLAIFARSLAMVSEVLLFFGRRVRTPTMPALEHLHHVILPMVALSLTGIGQIALHTREKVARNDAQ